MDAPSVAVSGDGKTIAAAWMDMRAGPKAPRVWCSRNGAETPLASDPKAVAGHPDLEFDSEGRLHAVWEEAGQAFYQGAAKPVALGKGRYPVLAGPGIAWESDEKVLFVPRP